MYPPFYSDIPFKTINIRDNLVIEDGVYQVGNGYHVGFIRIRDRDNPDPYGYIAYTLEDDGNFIINMIRVEDQYKRRGYATEMLRYVKRTYVPDREMDWGAIFEEGKLLRDSRKYDQFRKKINKNIKLKRKPVKKCSCKKK